MRLHFSPESFFFLALSSGFESDAGFTSDFFLFQAEDGIRDGRVTGVQTCALPIFDRKADGERPRQTAGEPHLVDDALVVVAAHEPFERRQRPRGEHVEVGELPRGQRQGLEPVELLGPRAGAVDEVTAVRRHEAIGGAGVHTGALTPSTRPSSASFSSTLRALSSGASFSVWTTTSAFSGTSYGSETPVNSLSSPAKAFA